MLGRVRAYVPGAMNAVDVQDVARGMVLADERGAVGERYILGNRNYTLERLFADLARVSGLEPPALRLSASAALRLARVIDATTLGRAPISPWEVKLSSQWWTYRNTKAKRELGWQPSPHEDTIEATVQWYLEREGDRIARERHTQPVQYRVAGAALGALGSAANVTRRLWPLAA
jgi:dihydroflavonol-4-reductase